MDFAEINVPVVGGLSYKQIEREALEFLAIVAPECLDTPMPTPTLEIFENKMDLLDFTVVVGKNIKGLGGVTDVTNRVIELPLATYKKLEKGVPQARFTAAHEFGHAKLHGKTRALGTFPSRENVRFARRDQLKAYEDPEWQANAFAAAALMPINTMRMLYEKGQMTVENVMEIYNVSRAAASRRVMKLENLFKA